MSQLQSATGQELSLQKKKELKLEEIRRYQLELNKKRAAQTLANILAMNTDNVASITVATRVVVDEDE